MDGHATTTTTEGPDGRCFRRHSRLLALAGAIIAIALGAAYLSVGHNPQPRDVPVAAVGGPAVAQALEAQAPGKLDVRAVPDLDAARKAIDEREVYAAVVPGPHGIRELVIASSASNQVANFMRRTLGAATPENVPHIVDAKPLPEDDSAGSSIPLLVQLIILGGSVGVLGLRGVLPRFQASPRRGVLPIAALLGYALVFGLAVTGISEAFGVGTDAAFVDRVLVFSFISLAVTASTAAMVSLIGAAGSAVAGTLYFVIGSQISGGNTALEFLSPFWSGLGEHLPGGAGTALVRDVLYFPEASMGEPIATLAAYVGVGVLVVLGLTALRGGRFVSSRRTAIADPARAHA
jgi:hypothetical protein